MTLLEQVRRVVRLRHYSRRTEETYLYWIERFVRFDAGDGVWRHPQALGAAEVEAFLALNWRKYAVVAVPCQRRRCLADNATNL